jgi:hypothetical protein
MSTDPKTPPEPPGPGLRWVRADEVLADDLIGQLDQWITTLDADDQAAVMRQRPRLVAECRAFAKLHCLQRPDQ